MNGPDSIKRMVQLYPGGYEAIAVRLGKAASTLEKELCGVKGYKFGLHDAHAIAAMCVEVRSPQAAAWLESVAAIHGAKVELPDGFTAGAGDIMHELSRAVREASDVTTAVIEGMEDGKLSRNDKRRIRKEVLEAMEPLQALLRMCESDPEPGEQQP